MAGWIINTVRIAIEQRRNMQKLDSNRFEEKSLKKASRSRSSRLGWSLVKRNVAKTFTGGGRHFCGERYCAETAVY